MAKKSIPDPPPIPGPKKKKSLLGDKRRAGLLLSSSLRTIAQEATEFIKDPEGDRMVTKAEALARLMWKMALGWTEKNIGTGIVTVHAPDRGMMSLIFDRVEGRAVPVNSALGKRRPLPNRVSDENKKRLNNMLPGTDAN